CGVIGICGVAHDDARCASGQRCGADLRCEDVGGMDAGSIDAGSMDAGSTDAGSTDAGSTDGGEGCASGEMRCDGACIDTSGALTSCGTCGNVCPTPPNAIPTCVGGTCGFDCNAGFADCDGAAANGCEADLSRPATCGS